MKVGLVHNPGAGRRATSTDELGALLRKHGYTPVPVPRDGAPADFARSAVLAFVAVAGGDGTLREHALALTNSGVAIAPLPVGTANNIARSLGIAGEPGEIVAAWDVTCPRAIDVGTAHGPWGRKLFLEGCGIGLIGRGISLIEEIDKATPRRFSDPDDKLHRDLSVFVALTRELAPTPLQINLDARTAADSYLLVEVLNIQHAGPRIHLSRRADPGDGFLDVVLATADEREKLHHSLITCLAGSTPDPILDNVKSRVVRLRFSEADFRIDDAVIPRSVRAAASESNPDSAPCVEVSLGILPGALQIIAPPEPR